MKGLEHTRPCRKLLFGEQDVGLPYLLHSGLNLHHRTVQKSNLLGHTLCNVKKIAEGHFCVAVSQSALVPELTSPVTGERLASKVCPPVNGISSWCKFILVLNALTYTHTLFCYHTIYDNITRILIYCYRQIRSLSQGNRIFRFVLSLPS